MILLNTTFAVDKGLRENFINYVRDSFIPKAVTAGMYAPLLTCMRQSPQQDSRDCDCLALQMRAPTQDIADSFNNGIRPLLYQEIYSRYRQGVVMFDTILDVVF